MSYVTSALWALVYYLVVCPASFVVRLFRRDPLALADDAGADTYWHPRPGHRFRPMTSQR